MGPLRFNIWAAAGADLGGSSKYSNIILNPFMMELKTVKEHAVKDHA